jgi:hypothetical protein
MTRRIHALCVGKFKAFADTQQMPVRDGVLKARRLRFKGFPALICTSKHYGRVCKTRPPGSGGKV